MSIAGVTNRFPLVAAAVNLLKLRSGTNGTE
jgi:hypothetical protein